MDVLSLFDGMSCGQIALERAGIKVDNYYASEIDKYAIKVTQENYPNTIQLGDIKNIKSKDLPKIDLLIGGSPCQGFSVAGKQLNFDDPRSALFFEFVRLLKECKPKYFLLENVRMKKEFQIIITKYLGVNPTEINSALVSAQNRKRLYWTNIPNIIQPKDKNILLKDIIEYGYVDKNKSYCVDANYFKGGNLKQYFEKCRRQLVFEKPHGFVKGGFKEKNKFNTLRSCTVHNYAVLVNKSQTILATLYKENAKSMVKRNKRGLLIYEKGWRKLLPIECERLQTVPDNYTAYVSNTQRYKMLGNGWTVDVIVHILKGIKSSKFIKQ